MLNNSEDWCSATQDGEYSGPEYDAQDASGSYAMGDEDDDGAASEEQVTRVVASDRKRRDEREANRIHCRETRERKRQKEKLLREVKRLMTVARESVFIRYDTAQTLAWLMLLLCSP